MALIICPECGQKISDQAEACIHCGYPLNNLKKENINEFYYFELIDYPRLGKKLTEFTRLMNRYFPDQNTVWLNKQIPLTLCTGLYEKNALWLKDTFSSIGATIGTGKDSNCSTPNDKLNNMVSSQIEDSLVVKCPRCKSTNIATGARGYRITTGFIGANKTVNRCSKCGYSWTP